MTHVDAGAQPSSAVAVSVDAVDAADAVVGVDHEAAARKRKTKWIDSIPVILSLSEKFDGGDGGDGGSGSSQPLAAASIRNLRTI